MLFNEPKLLKFYGGYRLAEAHRRFSALQRAEIAEMLEPLSDAVREVVFQCSSTSRNC